MRDHTRLPRALLLGSLYAGHRTRFQNLVAHGRADRRLRASYRGISGWHPGGLVECLPGIGPAAKGRIRSTLEAAAFARLPRPDVTWTSASEVLTPYCWAQLGPLRRPLVLDLDATPLQLDAMAQDYYGRPPRRGLARQWLLARTRLLYGRATVFTPWSRWAASGLEHLGVSPDRILVLPPGVDLDQWAMPPRQPSLEGCPLRLLFVAGDFHRKGGDLLVDLVTGPLASRCELDVVTRDHVEPPPGVRIHRAEANSPALRELFARADIFVLPTRAECFGIAAVEAMAAGLPVIMGDVGGARDIVEPGVTGWLIPPSRGALLAALEASLARRHELPGMGARARAVAGERFDGARNDARIIDLLVALAETRGRRFAGLRQPAGESPGRRINPTVRQHRPGRVSCPPWT